MLGGGGGGQIRNELIRKISTYESGCSGVSAVVLVLFYWGKKVRHPETTLVEGNVLSLG